MSKTLLLVVLVFLSGCTVLAPPEEMTSCLQLRTYLQNTVLPVWAGAEQYLADGTQTDPFYADRAWTIYERTMTQGVRLGCWPAEYEPLPIPGLGDGALM